jgi:hypothetical protein
VENRQLKKKFRDGRTARRSEKQRQVSTFGSTVELQAQQAAVSKRILIDGLGDKVAINRFEFGRVGGQVHANDEEINRSSRLRKANRGASE